MKKIIRVELFHAGIREKGTVLYESIDKKYWIVSPDDPRVTETKWSKEMCSII